MSNHYDEDMKFVISVPVKSPLSQTMKDLETVIEEMLMDVVIPKKTEQYRILNPSGRVTNAYLQFIPLEDDPDIHGHDEKNRYRVTERLHAIFFIARGESDRKVIDEALQTVRRVSLSNIADSNYYNVYKPRSDHWFYIKEG